MNADREVFSLYGCLALSEYPAQALLRERRTAGRPAVVLDGHKPWECVCATDSAARALGITAGMTRVEVETFGVIEMLRRSHTEEAKATAALLACVGLFSPRIQHFSTGSMWEAVIDLSGTEALLGAPQVLGQMLLARVEELGMRACLAVCVNVDAGRSLARYAACLASHRQLSVIPPGGERAALAPLPVTVLELEAEHAERLAGWGVNNLGELAALPATGLIARLGQVGKQMQTRARGELPHLLEPIPDRFRLEESIRLDASIDTVEQVLFCINPMLERLILRASSRALAVAEVSIALGMEVSGDRVLGTAPEVVLDGTFSRTIRPAVPVLDRALLLKMIQLEFEAHPCPGAITSVQLIAVPGDASRVQLGLFSPPTPEPTRFEDTHARLRALVGEEYVGRIRALDSHMPDPYRLERFILPPAATHPSVSKPEGARPTTALRRLRPSVEVRVWTEGKSIQSFVYQARSFEVIRCFGPWRSSGEWWGQGVWSYDAWDLAAQADDGELMMCVLNLDLLRQRWLLEGIYD